MSKLSSLFRKKSPTSSKLVKWLELTSIGVICTFGGFFVYHYTQTFAQSTPQQQPNAQISPIVLNTVVSKDVKEQMMENLPSKSLETSLKVKPIPYEGTDQTSGETVLGDSTSVLTSNIDKVEVPDTIIASTTPSTPTESTDATNSESTAPTNPIEIISDPEYTLTPDESAEEQGKNEGKQHPITAALHKQKPQPAAKEKPTPIIKPIISKTAASKPATSKPVTSKTVTSKTAASKTTASKTTASKTTAPKPAASKTTASKTAASKPAASKTTASKPAASKKVASKPAKPKAPYAVQKTFPGTKYFKTGANNKYVKQLGYMLVAAGYGKYYKVGPSPKWTSADLKNTKAYQRSQGWTGSDADGYPGPATWQTLYNKYYKKYRH